MNELKIHYTISSKLKITAIVASIALLAISLLISVPEALKQHFEIYFFIGIIGIVLAIILLLMVTVGQPKPMIILNNDEFYMHLPAQRIQGTISWDEIKHISFGLDQLIMTTQSNKHYDIKLENLKYIDLRTLKSRVIEICELKKISYNNL